jgi:hypothetical protein
MRQSILPIVFLSLAFVSGPALGQAEKRYECFKECRSTYGAASLSDGGLCLAGAPNYAECKKQQDREANRRDCIAGCKAYTNRAWEMWKSECDAPKLVECY